jgi:IclR family transcriptional regulator, KDG regulon repressor
MTWLGWLRKDPETKTYRLGIRLWELGCRAIEELEIRRSALPYLRRLVARTGESTDLAVLDGKDVVYIERVDGTREVRAFTKIGLRVPAHAVAMGKVLMAHLTKKERANRLSEPLERFTNRTIRTLAAFDEVCDEVLRRGYALNVGEHNLEAGGLAAPVFDRHGECVAALGVNVPATRLSDRYVQTLAKPLLETAAALSADGGYSGADKDLQSHLSA